MTTVVSAETRFDLAVKAFEHTAHYDGTIANYLGTLVDKKRSDEETNDTPANFPRTFQHAVPQSAGYALWRKPASKRGLLC